MTNAVSLLRLIIRHTCNLSCNLKMRRLGDCPNCNSKMNLFLIVSSSGVIHDSCYSILDHWSYSWYGIGINISPTIENLPEIAIDQIWWSWRMVACKWLANSASMLPWKHPNRNFNLNLNQTRNFWTEQNMPRNWALSLGKIILSFHSW